MDLASKCKEKLTHLRIKELKDILTQLGLSKQGKKMDMVDRILNILSDDQAHAVVHAVPRMWAKCSKEEVAQLIDDTYRKMQVICANDLATKSFSSISNVKPKEEAIETFKKIRCPCGISLETEPIIQCDDPRCNVWQHIGCVVLPEKPTDGLPQFPDPFFCEICRVGRADPFWLTLGHALYPVKLSTINVSMNGANTFQTVERTFQLTRADKDLLSKQNFDIQAWCMLLNDKVPFRMQWPQYAELQVNGVPVRTTNRPGSQLLGANGRDDGALISLCTKDGVNKISLAVRDVRIFCLGVRIVKRRTFQEIRNLIPKEGVGEPLDDAVARVRRCANGGASANADDDDSDVELVTDSVPFSLRCPMSGSRINIAGRFKPCAHMGCFDLEAFVQINERTRKWQCPICMKNYSLENLIIDPFFNCVTSMLKNCGEEVTEIELREDASWRPRPGTVAGDLALWHLPDGSICSVESDMKMENSTPVKVEGVSEGTGHVGLKLGLKKNRDGFWEVNMPDELHGTCKGRKVHECRKVIHMTSSGTSSGHDGDEASVNQHNDENLDNSALSRPVADADVIVLSDSENDADEGNRFTDTTIPQIINKNSLGAVEDTCLGLFGNNGDEMGLWQFPSAPVDPYFQLFGSVPETLVQLQQGYNLPPASSAHVNTTLASNSEGPSLQVFLPNNLHPGIRGQINASNRIQEDDWMSLRLGGGVDPVVNGDPGTAPFFGREKGNRDVSESSSNPFSCPRQRRSVRPRLYLNIDSDTE